MTLRWTFILLATSASCAAAAPLDPEACAGLNTEREGLIGAGVKTDMERGPDWAKTNLPAERLQKIARLIAVEEQLSFRCGQLVTATPQIKEPPKPEPQKAEASAAKPAGDGVAGRKAATVPPPKRKAQKQP